MNRTFLYESHRFLGAKFVNFSGWEMPIHYGSQINEHGHVRNNVGIFDVSHMSIFDFNGIEARNFLRYVLTNDVNKIEDGCALYSVITNNEGGIIDDLIVYKFNNEKFRIISNCSTFNKVKKFFEYNIARYDCELIHRSNLGILAIQGPKSKSLIKMIFDLDLSDLRSFSFVEKDKLFISRTGYTGEDGFELIGDHKALIRIWNLCISEKVNQIGLGARDTLRLEAGMNLNKNKLVGILLTDKGVLRNGQKIIKDGIEGEITSGTYSPFMKKSIGLARIPKDISDNAQVLIRNKLLNVRILSLPFVRKGKIMV